MDYTTLQKEAASYRGALLTEKLLSGNHVRALEKGLRILTLLTLASYALLFSISSVPFLSAMLPSFSAIAGAYVPLVKAALLLLLGLWLVPALLWAFFSSFYFKDANTALPEMGMSMPRIRFEVANIVTEGVGDPVVDFFATRFGGAVAARLGLGSQEIIAFLKGRMLPQTVFALSVPDGEAVGLEHFCAGLLNYDSGLKQFLVEHELDTADFTGAAAWVARIEEDRKEYLRWWSKDGLGRIPGIGKDWAYGEIAKLRRYATPITSHAVFAQTKGSFGKKEAEEVERVLSRGREANILLVGEEGVPKLAPLVRLARRIEAGTVLPPLEHKLVFIFDGVPFVAAMKEKMQLEAEVVNLLTEVATAGNIIFVFDNFDKFFTGAKALGSDLLAILDPFLTSANIQVVAISELGAFRQVFESNPKIRERFERVLIEGASVQGSLPILEEEALRAEEKNGIFFTYPVLRAVAESAERYFFEGVMPDKAIDLLFELVPKVKAAGKHIVSRADVLDLVTKKTGIKASLAIGEERAKLLKLEETLHDRVVGQDEAVKAISGALRRARSGISSPNRPMGSFLFIGPTGVGKTETTKALAQVFFGDESAITRLDMSEYVSDDALPRLIGTFESGKPGILASLLRERQYGVLLLDEFEKTNKGVHDLFLQILDEGFFTDVSGKRVNARNLIIIATSNAGSDLMWKLEQEGKPLDKDVVLTEIINRAIFKPELLNRFDGIILFRPLTSGNLRMIAKFMLKRLGKRLEERGVQLVITDALLDYLVSVGQDPKFGARPMNRAIQEKVEQVVAEKMLRGDITAGSRVELTPADLA